MMILAATPDKIVWEGSKGVPVSEHRKIEWVKECIERLKADPTERWAGISSGDTYIKVSRRDTFYIVEEFEPKRWAFIQRDADDLSVCSCDITTINAKGCQCGGI